MVIKLQTVNPPREKVLKRLRDTIARSRFVINSFYSRPHPQAGSSYKGGDITILGVRLKKRRHYWGQHDDLSQRPMARRGWGKGDPKAQKVGYMMAADWVEFNDLINDVLDEMGVKAFVQTRVCILRRGFRRRTDYRMVDGKTRWGGWGQIWDKGGDIDKFVENNAKLGLFPFSTFPDTCPGVYRTEHAHTPDANDPHYAST